MQEATASPFSKPLYVTLKPAGARCNLACEYCYYLEKSSLYPNAPRQAMSEEMLELFTKEYISAQTVGDILFTWHGGEAMMRPLSFYRKAIEFQQKYGKGMHIENVLQTNGTLMTPEWAKFLRDNHWLVGVSIDGPKEFHDEYRRARNGKPSWNKAMQAIRLLNDYGVEWNAMAVVNDFNADYPLEFYHFFQNIGCRFLQFTPVVERLIGEEGQLASLAEGQEAEIAPFSVSPQQWGEFLCTVFDEWVKHDVGQIFVEIFDCTLANWMGVKPGICSYGRDCGHAAVMEFNGDVYACDHFVFPRYKLGNIRSNSLIEMLYGEKQKKFAAMKRSLPRQCKECGVEFACHGECPKNRFVADRYGNAGLNYLCDGYHRFYTHVAPYMDFMRGELLAQRPPAGIMAAMEQGIFVPPRQ